MGSGSGRAFFYYRYLHLRYLHSFPTRRSSDLILLRIALFSVEFDRLYPKLQSMNTFKVVRMAKRGDKLPDRKSTRLNSSHMSTSYAVFCLKNKRECSV